ncbi:DMT family transporter [Clostridium botulinum]|nr:membrane protein [Clostridium botulinum]MBY6802493.1 DMT family transporter [Clostridium botulinum]MBY6812630.1 DMT family transporter [Clostridium botulinum]MBY6819262.1 DMT family transporter [Clostridium botulinum]NFJ50677.1 DMT family transporter [Clostridium botulinum]
MKSRIIVYLALFFGVFSLSSSAIFVKLADAPPSITAFYRLFFSTLILLPLLLFKNSNRHELLSFSKRQLGFGILSGLFLSIHYVLWFKSLNYTSVASSTVIVTLQPLFSISGGYFLFKERFNKGAIIGCFIAIIGCFIIGWGDFQVSNQAFWGDLLAFIAAGMITAYFFVGKHALKNLSLITYSIIGYSSSAFFLAIYSYSQKVSFVNYSLNTWLSFIGLAFIATILGQTILNWLLKYLSTSVISMSILGESIGTCILAYFILDETVSLQQGIGIMLILLGLVLFLFKKR